MLSFWEKTPSKGWLLVNYNLRFKYNLSVFTCYWRHHISKFAGACFSAFFLLLTQDNYQCWLVGILAWRKDASVKSSDGVDKRCLSPEHRHLLRVVRMNCFISAPCLRMQIIRCFDRHTTPQIVINRLLAAEYLFWRPARSKTDFVAKATWSSWVGQGAHRVWNLRRWRDCIFCAEFRFFICHSDGRPGERLIDACIQPTHGNRGSSVIVWSAIHHVGRSSLVILDGTMNRHFYIKILRYRMLPRERGVFGQNCVCARQCPATYSTWYGGISEPKWQRGHETNRAWDRRHGWPLSNLA